MLPPFDPPLINSSNRWATTEEDLQALYDCPYTGAVTIRTSLLNGFEHDENVHQHCFLKPTTTSPLLTADRTARSGVNGLSSLNTLGYSPVPLKEYVDMIIRIQERTRGHQAAKGIRKKPVIFSVTGSADEIVDCYRLLLEKTQGWPDGFWMMEINLSCPNIPNKPPPAYSKPELLRYLTTLQAAAGQAAASASIPLGIKTPPYTYQGQFDDLIGALRGSAAHGGVCPISFITAVNSLGTCLVLDEGGRDPALSSANGSGIGGLAGAAIHPLALGNVRTIRRMLDGHEELKDVSIIGVGGVADGAGYARMRTVGAAAVAVGTALGVSGVNVFEKIWREAGELPSLENDRV